MFTRSVAVLVSRPQNEVFAFVEDARNRPRWDDSCGGAGPFLVAAREHFAKPEERSWSQAVPGCFAFPAPGEDESLLRMTSTNRPEATCSPGMRILKTPPGLTSTSPSTPCQK